MTITYKSDNYNISLEHRTTGGDLIVFIHGLGCAKESFDDVWNIEELKNYSIVTFDLLGFGNSDKPQQFPYTLESHAEIANLTLEQFFHENVHIIGHSMGGAIGLLLADVIKSRLATYVSIEGNLISSDCGLLSRKTASAQFETIETFEKTLKKEFIDEFKTHNDKGSQLWLSQFKKSDNLAFYKSAQSLVSWSDSGKLLEKYNALPVPKRYFYGESNSDMEILEKFNDEEKVVISNSEHFVMNDNPNEFYSKLAEFLSTSPT